MFAAADLANFGQRQRLELGKSKAGVGAADISHQDLGLDPACFAHGSFVPRDEAKVLLGNAFHPAVRALRIGGNRRLRRDSNRGHNRGSEACRAPFMALGFSLGDRTTESC